MNAIMSYVHWARENPQKAHSLENMTRVFALSRTSVVDIVETEMWWSLTKMHAYINKIIVGSTSRSTTCSLTSLCHVIIGGMKVLENMLELVWRRQYGHKVAWDIILIWQSLKTGLSFIANRDIFSFSSIWLFIKDLQSQFFNSLPSARKLPLVDSFSEISPKDISIRDRINHGGDERMDAVSSNDSAMRQHSDCQGFEHVTSGATSKTSESTDEGKVSLRDDFSVSSTASVPLIVPRVVSSKLDRQLLFQSDSSGNRVSRDTDAAVVGPSASSASTISPACTRSGRIAGQFRINWLDLLGMLLDCYMLLRPLLLVAAGRSHFRAHQSKHPSLMPLNPGELVQKVAENAPTSVSHTTKEKKGSNKKENGKGNSSEKNEKTPILDSLSIVRTLVEVPRQRSLFPSWKSWVIFLTLDLITIVLARFVRDRRIPVVRIADVNLDAIPPVLQSDNEENANEGTGSEPSQRVGNTEGAEEGAGTSSRQRGHRGTTTTTSAEKSPYQLSQDERRIQHCSHMIRTSVLRDPFFSVGLKNWVFRNIMVKFLERIPLLGGIINYQLSYYFILQHFSFLHSLDL